MRAGADIHIFIGSRPSLAWNAGTAEPSSRTALRWLTVCRLDGRAGRHQAATSTYPTGPKSVGRSPQRQVGLHEHILTHADDAARLTDSVDLPGDPADSRRSQALSFDLNI